MVHEPSAMYHPSPLNDEVGKEQKMIEMQRQQQVRLLLLCSVIIACHTCTSYLEETLFKHKVGLTLYVQLAAYHGLVTHR
ncbi:MAG: hypothetical protein ACPIOQ_51175 [Promethearchaeia archaeon]